MSGARAARSGRTALWAVLVLVLLGAVAFVLELAGEREGSPRRPERSPPPAPLAPPAEEELQPPEVSSPAAEDVRNAPAEADGPARLVVHALVPGGVLGGTAQVEVREPSGVLAAVLELTAANPRAELERPAGEVLLTLAHVGAPPLAALPVRRVLRAGESEEVSFTLAPAARVHGSVVDASGAGLEEVAVALERGRTRVAETRTRFGGAFDLGWLPEGEYELVLGDPLGPLIPRRTVRAGEGAALELVVPVLCALEVRVVDGDGLGAPGAHVEGEGESGGRVAGETDAEGVLRAQGLPPGNWRLYASHARLGRGDRAFVLAPGTSEPLEIRLHTRPPAR